MEKFFQIVWLLFFFIRILIVSLHKYSREKKMRISMTKSSKKHCSVLSSESIAYWMKLKFILASVDYIKFSTISYYILHKIQIFYEFDYHPWLNAVELILPNSHFMYWFIGSHGLTITLLFNKSMSKQNPLASLIIHFLFCKQIENLIKKCCHFLKSITVKCN